MKAAHQNNVVREKKIQQQLNFTGFLNFSLSRELRCDRQVCESLARLLLIEVWRHR